MSDIIPAAARVWHAKRTGEAPAMGDLIRAVIDAHRDFETARQAREMASLLSFEQRGNCSIVPWDCRVDEARIRLAIAVNDLQRMDTVG